MPSSRARRRRPGAAVARVAGAVAAVDLRRSARGTRFGFVRLSDPTGLFEVRMFADALDAARDALAPGRCVVLMVEATVEGEEMRLLAKAAQPIDVALAGAASAGLRIYLNEPAAAASLAARLAAVSRDVATRRRGPVEIVAMTLDLGEIALDPARPLPAHAPGARRAQDRCRGWCISRSSEAIPGAGRGMFTKVDDIGLRWREYPP